MSDKTKSVFDRLCRNLFDEGETQPPPASPTSFGRFRLLEELGRGGMGVVWKAFDPTLDREVALKILQPTGSPQEHQRILREARAPSRAPHPGIVKIHEMGEIDGRPFLVMDLVGGRPLSALSKAPLRKKVEVIAQIAEALDHAHRQGVIHRDIKPSNILVTAEGRPVLVDFGLARTIGRDERVTQTGAVFGTPYYMSPEAADGSPADVDSRSDLYSLGVLMYELLSGRVPFAGKTPMAVIQNILTAQPTKLQGVPPALEAVVFKAMSKRKEDRYASAGELAQELRTWLAGGDVTVRPPSRFRKLRLPVAAAAALLALALALWIFSPPGLALAKFTAVPVPAAGPRPEPVEIGNGDRPLEPQPWRRAVRAAFDGKTAARDAEVAEVRAQIKRVLKSNPHDMWSVIAESHLLLLEGREHEAIAHLDRALEQGRPEEEIRSLQLGIILSTSSALRILERPYRIDFPSILKDPRFVDVWNALQRFRQQSPVAIAVEKLLEGKDAEVRPEGRPEDRRAKPGGPTLRLLVLISTYNLRREFMNPHEVLEDFPTPFVASIVALHHLAAGRLDETKGTLDRVEPLGRSDVDPVHHLRALLDIEADRWPEAEARIRRLKNDRVRRYTQGILELLRSRPDAAASELGPLSGMYQAEFHLACARIRDSKIAFDLVYEAVKHATAAGEYNLLRGDPPRHRFRNLHHALPFFTLGKPALNQEKWLEPLRIHVEYGPKLREIAGQ